MKTLFDVCRTYGFYCEKRFNIDGKNRVCLTLDRKDFEDLRSKSDNYIFFTTRSEYAPEIIKHWVALK